jgi:hypothetical protein
VAQPYERQHHGHLYANGEDAQAGSYGAMFEILDNEFIQHLLLLS